MYTTETARTSYRSGRRRNKILGGTEVRIISGRFKSRRLKAAPPAGIRPTSDKLRETIFNILGPRVSGSIFLDGCAGMGGVGLEAVSRGAAMVHFVDQNRRACKFIRENLQALEVEDGFRILEMDLAKALGLLAKEEVRFDIAYVDPPYKAEDVYEATLRAFSTRPLLSGDGLLILEHSKRTEMPESAGNLRLVRSLVQGDAALAFYRLVEPPPEPM